MRWRDDSAATAVEMAQGTWAGRYTKGSAARGEEEMADALLHPRLSRDPSPFGTPPASLAAPLRSRFREKLI
ncbi:hypothetical protein GUJ93_ZPchr0006g42013 [Zizania palustris]|uniref:Uncharacterized protein n=1 Tax=Zizania palustris TaxID=103762 RepID=A0A8J5SD16_ZIZPA|nr:hypothetical protein GUJ93_ZPchr0006g42013 [Zizania palustris]